MVTSDRNLRGGAQHRILHHPSDIFTSGQQPGDSKQDLLIPEPVDSGSGSRRNRNRGKGKNTGPWSKDPSGDRLKDQPDSETIPGSDRGKVVGVGSGDSSVGGNKDISNLQICNLNDLVHGHWVYSESIRKTIVGSQGSNPAGDQSWTGYGPLGCRSHIWNERYLLTPNVNSLTSAYSTPPQLTRASLLNQNRNYATHMQSFSWVLDHGQSENGQIDQKTSRCQQPEMDVGDFIEVLKRSPLIMVGDKFLEQEFLSLECMVMGLQDQLLKNYRTEHQIKGTDNESVDWKIMDYHIESEMPPTVELKIAPGRDAAVFATQQKSKQSPQSSSPVPKVPSSNIYRKAKPGQMKLVDMKSNLTLATFIRSDVLWDAGMFSPQTTDHEALHPDCKLVGPVLMCEPPPQLPNTKSPSGSGAPTRKGSWFSWWIGEQDQQGSTKGKAGKGESQNMDESAEFWVGSDLERDMINLEWVDMLRQIVDAEGEASKDSRGSRTPLMVISNGIFWSYDPLDALLLDETFRLRQQHGPKRLTKVERDQALKLQDTRRKLLRRRYTTVLSHTLEFLKATYPELRVIIQTSVRRHQDCPTSRSTKSSAAETVVRDDRDQEDALLNELTRVVVARMQDSRFSFLDTTFLRLFNDTSNLSRRYCHRFMMPGKPSYVLAPL
ncbi:hypothetical protein BGW38_010934 [Lunasporangiospora selenospora]|uniref:Uncharacterized protein n=1 Tax=Lunasporangiospora selenospora TaxID=979761 RepID=A0A9P6FWD2_9FUNG|nr:hypothetical protein BGW38_010934 [Lunasporangiospora selenospora]